MEEKIKAIEECKKLIKIQQEQNKLQTPIHLGRKRIEENIKTNICP